MSNHFLGDRKEFNFNELDKEKIRVFCGFAEKFYKGVYKRRRFIDVSMIS